MSAKSVGSVEEEVSGLLEEEGCLSRWSQQIDPQFLSGVFDPDTYQYEASLLSKHRKCPPVDQDNDESGSHDACCRCDECVASSEELIHLRHHPECAVDEAYLGKVTIELFSALRWKTKRLGKAKATRRGKELHKCFRPLFVKIHELLENGVSIDADE